MKDYRVHLCGIDETLVDPNPECPQAGEKMVSATKCRVRLQQT